MSRKWIEPVLLNGWENVGGVYSSAGYIKDDEGRVHLKGTLQGKTTPSTIFILPLGHRIAEPHNLVRESGEVQGFTPYVSLNGISFMPDALTP